MIIEYTKANITAGGKSCFEMEPMLFRDVTPTKKKRKTNAKKMARMERVIGELTLELKKND